MAIRVHLVDGTFELFRSYYGAPKALAPNGAEVGATRGLMRSLLALLREDGVTHVGIAFDHVIESFRNALFVNPGHGRHWLTLRLRGVRSNRGAVGARIDLLLRTPAGERRLHRRAGTGGSFGSSSLQQEIGLGDAREILELRITWPASGRVQVFREVAMDRVLAVREDSDRLEPAER